MASLTRRRGEAALAGENRSGLTSEIKPIGARRVFDVKKR
jgi:hypothetical protein